MIKLFLFNMYYFYFNFIRFIFQYFFFKEFLNYPPLKFYNSSETGPVYLITSCNDEKNLVVISLDYFFFFILFLF